MTVYDDDIGTLREMHEWLLRRETRLRRCLAWISAGVALWLLVTSCREKPAQRPILALSRVPPPPGGGGHP
jgi:hypothetical protein